MFSSLRFAVIALLCLLAAVPACAQKSTSTLTGKITNQTGDGVGDATVTISNPKIAYSREEDTNKSGIFAVADLEPGTYTVKVVSDGYRTVVFKGVVTHAASITQLDVPLTEGNATPEIAGDPGTARQVSTRDLGRNVNATQATELPNAGRNFINLTTLVPGVLPVGPYDPRSKGFPAGSPVAVTGARPGENLYSLDSGNSTLVGARNLPLLYPSLDAISEFRVVTHDVGPEYPSGLGGHVIIATRQGTADFHGSAFYQGSNDALNSWSVLSKMAQPGVCPNPDPTANTLCDKNSLDQNDFGFTLGGPLKTDKAFFFVSEEWNREDRGITRAGVAPTAAMQAGDFSAISTCPLIGTLTNGVLPGMPAPINQSTGLPIGALAPGQISPAGLNFLRMYNTANVHLNDPCLTNPASFGFNWAQTVSALQTWRQDNVRGDIVLSPRNTLMLRFTQDTGDTPWQSNLLWSFAQPWTVSGTNWDSTNRSAMARLTSTLGAGSSNALQVSWTGSSIDGTLSGTNPAAVNQLQQSVPQQLGIKALTQLPSPSFTGDGNAGPIATLSPFFSSEDLRIYRDDFTKVGRVHIFQLGITGSQNAHDIRDPQGNELGQFGAPLGLLGAPVGASATTGNGFADLALRNQQFFWNESSQEQFKQVRWTEYAFYGNDTWQISPHVTVSMGVRWSFLRQPTYADNTLATFVPLEFRSTLGSSGCNGIVLPPANAGACRAVALAGGTEADSNALAVNNNHLLEPRVGFAWDLGGRHTTVVRLGFGQFMQRDLAPVELFGSSPPFNLDVLGQRGLDARPTSLSSGANGPLRAFDTSSKLANNWQAHLTVEHQISRNTTARLSYTAVRGIHLLGVLDLNQIPPGLRQGAFAAGNDSTTLGTLAPLRPFGVVTNAPILTASHFGSSLAHSGQGSITSRLKNDLLFTAAYTWSRNITDVNEGMLGFQSALTDNSNARLDRGPADITRKNVFTSSLVYSLPLFKRSGGFAKGVLGGWRTSALVTVASGAPLNVLETDPRAPLAGPDGTGTYGTTLFVRPNRDFTQPCHMSSGNPLQWLNPASFTLIPLTGGAQDPNAGPGTCIGPPVQNFDLSIGKDWSLPGLKTRISQEGMKLQFRVDVFNFLNHVQLSSPNVVLGTATFGQAAPAPYSNRELHYNLRLVF